MQRKSKRKKFTSLEPFEPYRDTHPRKMKRPNFNLVQQIKAGFRMDRANCDKSMKFGIHRHFATLKKMRVGPILKIASIPYF